ncbi:MAG: hypothetical protein ACJAQT_004889 [Akkermansiaceae bacterium]|jgi:hypothetical protein
MANGDWVVPPLSGKEFLRAVLDKLNVLEESQVLVFSKTSLQNSLITDSMPLKGYDGLSESKVFSRVVP